MFGVDAIVMQFIKTVFEIRSLSLKTVCHEISTILNEQNIGEICLNQAAVANPL